MQKTIRFRNGKISFSDEGKGRVVVLIHGFLGSKEIWSSVHASLAKNYRVIAVDLPGHGSSDCFGYVHSMELMAKAIKEVLTQLKLKKVTLIGHSMGGYVALAFAELFPDHVRGLCLFHSSSFSDTEEKKKDRTKAIRAVKENPKVYVRATIKNLFATHNLKQMHDHIIFSTKIAIKTSRRGIVACLEGMKDRKSRDIILHFANYPIMMIIGKYDNVLPFQLLLNQSKILQHPHVLILENAGHMGFLESPERCVKDLKRFIRDSFGKYKPLK